QAAPASPTEDGPGPSVRSRASRSVLRDSHATLVKPTSNTPPRIGSRPTPSCSDGDILVGADHTGVLGPQRRCGRTEFVDALVGGLGEIRLHLVEGGRDAL